MKKNERLEALSLLLKVLKEKIPLTQLLQLKSPTLTPFAKEICFGVCRHFYRLEAMADYLIRKRPKAYEVWVILLMGLYQLHFMKKPQYAVVKETVAMLEALKKTWAKGLVNAVLRTFCREQLVLIEQLKSNQEYLYGHPLWFIERIKVDWPHDWQKILAANDCHPPLSLRVNRLKIDREHYLQKLQTVNITAMPHVYSPVGITLAVPCDVIDLPAFAEGEASVQDESAQLAAYLLDLHPNYRVLDACCAPGGKTCHILETEPNLAECVALDIDEKRLERVKENLLRCKLNARIIKGDALHPLDWWDGKLFDRILLDAPCSATGVIRRHPDIKLLRTKAEIDAVSQLQWALLKSLWPLLAPQGLLVYATCSIIPQENELQIAQFIKSQEDCELMLTQQTWGHYTGHGWQILPGEGQKDGFFYSVLRKKYAN